MIQRFVDAAFDGSAEGLVLALLEGGDLSAEKLERMKAVLEEAEAKMQEKDP